MSSHKIIKTRPGDAVFGDFEELPRLIYPKDSLRFAIPERLNEEFLISCFMLADDHTSIARIALYSNPQLRYLGKKTICLGNYECINNIDAAKAILNHALREAQNMGAEYVLGPMDGCTWDNYRFCTNNDYRPFFLEPINPIYYNDHYESVGFEVIAKYFTSIDQALKYDSPEIVQRAKEFKDRGVVLRSIDLEQYSRELEKLYPFLLETFKSNFLYTSISQDCFLKKYLASERYIDPRFVLIVEDKEGNTVGLFFCVHDHFDKSGKTMIVKTLARHPDKKWKGLGHVMGNEITKRCASNGYTSMIHALIYEQGSSINLSKNYSGKVYKNYCLYGRNIIN
ncbi:MAG TPA: hypothetical protein VF691_17915 [Cytophagaceae bacterium]|jgi:hypothetical protein